MSSPSWRQVPANHAELSKELTVSESETPGPKPTPRPAPPSPAALAGRKPAVPLIPAAPPVAEHDPADVEAALGFGSVGENGEIFVQDGTQKRQVGTIEGAGSAVGTDHDGHDGSDGANGADGAAATQDPSEAMRPLAHAYLDLVAFLDVTEQRLAAPHLTQADLNRLLEKLRKNLKEPQAIGDIPALRHRAADLREQAKEKIQALEAERHAARDEATARRTAFVESIEQLVDTDPERMSWKQAGETIRQMVPEWKEMQKAGPSLERSTEDALWKRLSAARSSFDRKRRHFFAHLDEQHAEAEQIKDDIIARAEAMQDSTDWGPTVRAFRSLMDEWRSAPRGGRKKDDAQWARFKAAQDTFFTARNEDLRATDEQQQENLRTKESLLSEARAVDPQQDLDGAKKAFRSILDRWEDAGKVPRRDMRRIEDSLRAVEQDIKRAEEDEWRRTDPRTRARVQGASSQLQDAIAEYEQDLASARADGDPAKIRKAEEALAARQQWLAVIERSAKDLD
jgi:hypothetical protein